MNNKNCVNQDFRWTIALVNYHSSVYIGWQLKILYEFNNRRDFQVIIIDNSSDANEMRKLNKLSSQYPNVTIVHRSYSRKVEIASVQHGNGLNIALQFAKLAKSKLFLTLDPDCFVLSKNFLDMLEDKIVSGCVAFGTEYSIAKKKMIKKHNDFPCAFACAYNLDVMSCDISFSPSSNDAKEIMEAGSDVGYQIREEFANLNYMSFQQKILKNSLFFQSSLFVKDFEYYFFEGKLTAVHFNKTSRKLSEISRKKFSSISFIQSLIWNLIRNAIAKKCYDMIAKNIVVLDKLVG